MTYARPTSARPPARRSAFTLIELMISIALVLLLILGVNQVFFYVSQAVGAGETINAAVRDGRSVQTVFANDFAGIVPNGGSPTDSAFIAIHSTAQPTFLNAADLAADKDGNPLTQDLNGDGTEGDVNVPGEVISPATYNYRNHRLDMLSFFARGSFQRQTGNDGTFVDNMSSSEAWVSYGHLWLPDNTGTFDNPATPSDTSANYPGVTPAAGSTATNPMNRFASQLVLGRVAMLLRTLTPATPPISAGMYDANGVSQSYVAAQNNSNGPAGDAANTYFVCPLFSYAHYAKGTSSVVGSVTTVAGTSQPLATIGQSRIDLAENSIQSIQSSLSTYLYEYGLSNAGSVDNKWWYQIMGLPPTATAPPSATLVASGPPARFQCVPVVPKPLTAAAMAQASPYFIKGCSHFIVEYAGDFLTQNSDITNNNPITAASPGYGAVTSAGSDGQIDYVLIPPTGVSSLPPRSQWRKQIIWYGLPRNTSGQSGINKYNGDVVPLRDWRQTANPTPAASPYYAAFEKTLPTYQTNYAAAAPAGMKTGETYTCVFGPNDPAPMLIRITVTLVDPTGRLPEGQTYQYVYTVPPQ